VVGLLEAQTAGLFVKVYVVPGEKVLISKPGKSLPSWQAVKPGYS
jgi:hypothetical protein